MIVEIVHAAEGFEVELRSFVLEAVYRFHLAVHVELVVYLLCEER